MPFFQIPTGTRDMLNKQRSYIHAISLKRKEAEIFFPSSTDETMADQEELMELQIQMGPVMNMEKPV